MLRTRHLVGAITLALVASTSAHAARFSNVVVIGDSLSDNGNIALATGAPAISRFTTNPGTTTAENVAKGLGFELAPSLAGGTDYAFGGATVTTLGPQVPTLVEQFQMYLAANGGQADGNALYQVWGGANDMFALMTSGADSATLVANTIGVAQTEIGLLDTMQTAGARYVVVYNLPDLGKTPTAAAGGAAAQAGGTQLATLYNQTLDAGLAQLSNAGLNVIPVNTYALINEVIANPAAFGFSNVTAPACTGGSGSSIECGPAGSGAPVTYAPGSENDYLFADGVHPTTAAHAMLGQLVLSEINAPGQISLLGEAPLGAAFAQSRVARRQMLDDSLGAPTRSFVNIDYAQQHYKADANAPKTRSSNLDFSIGADAAVSDHVSAGIGFGVGRHHGSFAGGIGDYNLQDISAQGYLTYHRGGGYIGGFIGFGQSNYDEINRHVRIGTLNRREAGKADGNRLGGGFTGGWWFETGKLRTGPFTTVEWQTVKVNGYNEAGNDSTAMWFGRQQRDALVMTAGWRLQGDIDVGNTVLSPWAELAWNHDDKADPRLIRAGLNSMSGTFALPGFEPDANWANLSIGVSARLTSSINSWFGYNGRIADRSQKFNGLTMGFKVKF